MECLILAATMEAEKNGSSTTIVNSFNNSTSVELPEINSSLNNQAKKKNNR